MAPQTRPRGSVCAHIREALDVFRLAGVGKIHTPSDFAYFLSRDAGYDRQYFPSVGSVTKQLKAMELPDDTQLVSKAEGYRCFGLIFVYEDSNGRLRTR